MGKSWMILKSSSIACKYIFKFWLLLFFLFSFYFWIGHLTSKNERSDTIWKWHSIPKPVSHKAQKRFAVIASRSTRKDPSVYDNLQQCFSLFRSSFYCILNSEFTCLKHNSPENKTKKGNIDDHIEQHRTRKNILFYLSPLVCCEIEIIPRLIHIVECCALYSVHIVRCAMHGWIHIIIITDMRS